MEAGDEREREATVCLRAVAAGDEGQKERLVDLVYAELHQLASTFLARERADHTLQPTALVHEAYLSLIDQRKADWNDRRHFLAIAALAMRRHLVDHARGRSREKRGGGWRRVELDEEVAGKGEDSVELGALEEALARLRQHSARLHRIVELRFFSGLAMEEIAQLEGVSERTLRRDWRFARSWLYQQLGQA